MPAGFDEAFADLSHEQILDCFDRWPPRYQADADVRVLPGDDAPVRPTDVDHLDEWRATR